MSGRGVLILVAAQVLLAAIFAALTATLAAVPGLPLWDVLAPALAALAAVCGATLTATAWLTRRSEGPLGPRPPDLPPLRHAERYAADPRDWHTLTWHAHSPDRPSAQRPSPGLTWHCPVVPGKPRTVRDLHRKPPRDLSAWE